VELNQFEVKKAEGEKYEQELDNYFTQLLGVNIKKVSMELQLLGVDRIFTGRSGRRWSVEYKADIRAAQTGNFFIEILTNDNSGKKGWAYTSIAQRLVLYIPGKALCYIIESHKIKSRIEEWLDIYPVRSANNGHHNSEGIIIPIEAFINACKAQTFQVEI